jgi:hypothetical protein
MCLERSLVERNLLLCLSSSKEERCISILVRVLGMVLWHVWEGDEAWPSDKTAVELKRKAE